jgi:hypothetical protein
VKRATSPPKGGSVGGYFKTQNYWPNFSNTDITYPSRSCDLTPCDFFLWPYLKNSIIQHRLNNLNELHEVIVAKIGVLNSRLIKLKMRLDIGSDVKLTIVISMVRSQSTLQRQLRRQIKEIKKKHPLEVLLIEGKITRQSQFIKRELNI